MYIELQNVYEEHIKPEELVNLFNKAIENNEISYYSFILHNQDVTLEGNLKKPHYHIILDINKPGGRSFKDVYNYCSFAYLTQRVEKITNVKKFSRYLLHMDDKKKHQYALEEVYTSDPQMYIKLTKINEPEKVNFEQVLQDLLKYLFELCKNNGSYTSADVYRFFINNGCLNYYVIHKDKIDKMIFEMFNDGAGLYYQVIIDCN